MSPSQVKKPPKIVYKHRIAKKKQNRSKSHKWSYKSRYSSSIRLGNINEILRMNKKLADKGWRVVPKDSCEVYRERRNRRQRVEDSNEENKNMEEPNNRPRRKARKRKSGGRGRPKKRQSAYSMTSISSASSKLQSSSSDDME